MGRTVPDRWLDYSGCGDRILSDTIKTRFISFKVPLKQDVCANLQPQSRFCPTDLLTTVKEKDQKLGLIIDLTFTSRYYDKQVFEKHGIRHVKIMCEGQMVPRKVHSDSFAYEVKRFTDEYLDEDVLIGVHCTHGVNRTGYLICRYMIDHMAVAPQDAIDLFNKCRGHEQERESYIQHLLTNQLSPADEAVYYNPEETISRPPAFQRPNHNHNPTQSSHRTNGYYHKDNFHADSRWIDNGWQNMYSYGYRDAYASSQPYHTSRKGQTKEQVDYHSTSYGSRGSRKYHRSERDYQNYNHGEMWPARTQTAYRTGSRAYREPEYYNRNEWANSFGYRNLNKLKTHRRDDQTAGHSGNRETANVYGKTNEASGQGCNNPIQIKPTKYEVDEVSPSNNVTDNESFKRKKK